MGRTITHMQALEYPIKDILPILRTNREAHVEKYQAAKEAYRTKCIELLSDRLAEVQKGTEFRDFLSFDAPKPVCYVKVYDTVIKMLELCAAETIELESYQFQAWVEDQWEWTPNFNAVTIPYSS